MLETEEGPQTETSFSIEFEMSAMPSSTTATQSSVFIAMNLYDIASGLVE